MIETYAITAGVLFAVGAVLGILAIWALGVRCERANREAAGHADLIAVSAHPASDADAVVYSTLPEAASVRQPELTPAGPAMAAAGTNR